ncbi:MAG: hypothetical protein JWN64_363 [Parcubacteria group bacterium]|nr:hypothetical protein [Parcubacteria group bacterium]
MSFTPRHVLYGVLGLALVASACLLYAKYAIAPVSYTTEPQEKQATSTPLSNIEIVSEPAVMERGLGGRANVPAGYGMLFVFPEAEKYGFWMKDMLVPIDIVWLSDTKQIVKIDANVATSTYPDSFYPPMPVRYVLETKAGYAKEQGWEKGTDLSEPLRSAK